jgi:hypothetical protein
MLASLVSQAQILQNQNGVTSSGNLTGDVTTSGSMSKILTTVYQEFAGNTAGNTIAAAVTQFYSLTGNSITNALTSDASQLTRTLNARAVSSATIYLKTSAAVGSGKTDTVTLLTNGVSTGVTVTISGASQTSNNGTGTFASLPAGNEIGISIATVASSTAVKWSWAIKLK